MEFILSVLYVVATPIGNLQDITYRAVSTLKSVDIVAVEDTRQSRKLWVSYGIETRMLILNKDNESGTTVRILDLLAEGKSVAIISDAGTPLIHDPGLSVVGKAKDLGFKVVPIPGASAVITALSAAGFRADNFIFCGFLPVKDQARLSILQKLVCEEKTLVFYEAPHRIIATINAMMTVFGAGRSAVLAREMTKIHEEIVSSSIGEILSSLNNATITVKGEMVVIVAGCCNLRKVEESLVINITATELLKKILPCMSVKDAVSLAQQLTKLKSNDLYKLALSLQ